MSNPSGLSDEDEKRLLEVLQSQPDWECLPIPAYWFKKYGIPPREAVGPKEYIESNYAMRKAVEPKDLPPLLIDEPQYGGRLVALAPPEKVDIQLVSRPFVSDPNKPFPAVICPEETSTPECHTQVSPGHTSQSVPYPPLDGPRGLETEHQVQAPHRLSGPVQTA